MITINPDDEALVKSLAALPSELAQSFLAIGRALRPNTRKERLEFDRRIRRALRHTPPEKMLARTILQQVLKR